MTHLAYRRPGHALAVALAISGALGCTAGVRSSTGGAGGTGATTVTGSGGSGASSGGSTGAGGSFGSGGTTSSGDVGITGSGGSPDTTCQQMDLTFKPTTPTVFILVDRSGSEFDAANNGTTGTFFQLRTAVEQVIAQLDSKVRFGFGAFVGEGYNPMCKIDFTDTVVPIALNNSGTIKTQYDSLGMLPNMAKANTPMSDVIPMVKSLLVADKATFDGDKYMMVVTDSETDFCDDGGPVCPADAVTYMIQDLYTNGIGTLVVGLPASSSGGTGDAIASIVLQNMANAGAGQPVAVPPQNPGQTQTAANIYDACHSVGGNPSTNTWLSVYTAAGHTATDHTSIATYADAGGTAKVFAPSSTDTQALVTQISAALNSIPRSCTFDLSTFQIDADKLNEAVVYLVDSAGDQMNIPLDSTSTDGWYMTDITATKGTNGQTTRSATQLQLFGSWCDKLRAPTTTDIKFNFPCDVIITIN